MSVAVALASGVMFPAAVVAVVVVLVLVLVLVAVLVIVLVTYRLQILTLVREGIH
jgi:hypothetical protein